MEAERAVAVGLYHTLHSLMAPGKQGPADLDFKVPKSATFERHTMSYFNTKSVDSAFFGDLLTFRSEVGMFDALGTGGLALHTQTVTHASRILQLRCFNTSCV